MAIEFDGTEYAAHIIIDGTLVPYNVYLGDSTPIHEHAMDSGAHPDTTLIDDFEAEASDIGWETETGFERINHSDIDAITGDRILRTDGDSDAYLEAFESDDSRFESELSVRPGYGSKPFSVWIHSDDFASTDAEIQIESQFTSEGYQTDGYRLSGGSSWGLYRREWWSDTYLLAVEDVPDGWVRLVWKFDDEHDFHILRIEDENGAILKQSVAKDDNPITDGDFRVTASATGEGISYDRMELLDDSVFDSPPDSSGTTVPDDPNWSLIYEEQWNDASVIGDRWEWGWPWGVSTNVGPGQVTEEMVSIDENEQMLTLRVRSPGTGDLEDIEYGAIQTSADQWRSPDNPILLTNEGTGDGFYVEARIRNACGFGTHEAWWLYPNVSGYETPEIDVMELFDQPDRVRPAYRPEATVHYNTDTDCGSPNAMKKSSMWWSERDSTKTWNIYGCEVRDDYLAFHYNGQQIFYSEDSKLMTHLTHIECQPWYLLLSNSTGAAASADTEWECDMDIDWVRVYHYGE